MKKSPFLFVVIVTALAAGMALYFSHDINNWDSFDAQLVEKSHTINEVLSDPEDFLNQEIILRTNWIPNVDGPWLADNREKPLRDDSSLSFIWAVWGNYKIYSETGTALRSYPADIPRDRILAVGIFRIGDYHYPWGVVSNQPYFELQTVYFETEKR